MPLSLHLGGRDSEYYYTENFKTLVRSMREVLRGQQMVSPLTDRALVYSCRNNIYKLLRALEVPEEMLWATAFINDIEDPFQDITGLEFLYMVDTNVLNNAISRSNTVHG